MRLAAAGGALVALGGIWAFMWLFFRMMNNSGEDWGLAYNIWEKSPDKEEENRRRGLAQQARIARTFYKGLPIAGAIAIAGIALVVIAATG